MKLAPPTLPTGWEETERSDGTIRVSVLRGTRGCGATFGWTILCLAGLLVYGCSGLYSLFGDLWWLPPVAFGGLWLYRSLWLLMETETWHLSPERIEVRTSLLGIRGTREAWKRAKLLVAGPSNFPWELRLIGDAGERCLHQSESLEEVLSLAASVSDRTGWTLDYTELGTVFYRVLDTALERRDAGRVRLLLENRRLLPALALQVANERRRDLLLALLRQSEAEAPAIEAALNDGHAGVQAAAIDLLAALEDRRALPSIRGVLAGTESSLRARAADALGRLRDAEAVPALCDGLRQGDSLPPAAARALGMIGDPQSVPALCETLLSGNQVRGSEARWEAAVALGRIRDRRAVTALCEALADMIHQVREAAADSLGQLGDAEAVPALCRSLYDPAGHVAARAAAALGRIRDESAAPALCGVMITGVAATRAEAAGALARIGSDQATQALCRALEDPEGNVRLEAAAGLGGIASSSTHPPIQLRAAVPTLKRLSAPLSTERADIKRACKDALQRIETRTAHIKGLPLPAESAAPSPDTLPRPSHGEEAGE